MSGFRFEHFSPERKRAKKSESISAEAWITHNSAISELFSQKLGYEEIRERITTEDFKPSLRQLKGHLKQLGLSRYGQKPPGNNGQTASGHLSLASNTAIAADEPLNLDVVMSEHEAELNSLAYFPDYAATGSSALILSTVSDFDHRFGTDTDTSIDSSISIVDIAGTAVEANVTQINSSAELHRSSCAVVDLSRAFNTSIEELARGHRHEDGSRLLGVLAGHLMNTAAKERIAVSDRTLAQVILAIQETFPLRKDNETIHEGIQSKWQICASRVIVENYAVVIRISVHHRERDSYGDSRLALRMRITSPQSSVVENILTLIVCPGLLCSTALTDAMKYEDIDEARNLLSSGDISMACILANAQIDDVKLIDDEVSEMLTKFLIAQILELGHAFSTSLPLLINFWEVVYDQIIVGIWLWFVIRWNEKASSPEESFQEQFLQCKEVTSIAQRNGSLIDEFVSETIEYLLDVLMKAVRLSSAQRLQLLQYFRQLGLNLEIRGFGGRTPLLELISTSLHTDKQKSLDIISDLLLPEVNANLHAKDDMGHGYLRIAFGRLGFLCSSPIFCLDEWFDFNYQSKLLALLLSKDETFRERAITPKETPRLTELAFSAVAWDVWTSVFEQLNWDMDEMNTYRYKILQRPMLGEFLAPDEEARVQMLGQTRFRLGRDKVEELDREYRNTRIGYR